MSSSAFTPTQTQITNNVPTNVPIVEAWQSYTPTFSNFGTVTNIAAWYRRVGDSIQIYARYVTGTTVASPVTISLPSGLNTDVSKSGSASRVIGRWYRQVTIASNRKTGCIIMRASSQNVVSFGSDDYSTAVGPLDEVNGTAIAGSGETHTCEFTVPIAEWAGSGTTTLATRAVEEYLSVASGTTTPTVYGPAGSLIGTGRAGTTIVLNYQNTIQSTDSLVVEFNPAGTDEWIQRFPYYETGSSFYGCALNGTASSGTLSISFASGGYSAGTSATWDSISTWKWRVRKVSSGAQVGYPVSARNIIGDTSGTAVPTGMIGEIKTFSILTNTLAAAGTATNLASITLNKGNYLIVSKTTLEAAGVTWASDAYFGISVSLTSATLNSANEGFISMPSNGSRTNRLMEPLTVSNDNTSIYIIGRAGTSSGNAIVSVSYPQSHYAIRIG